MSIQNTLEKIEEISAFTNKAGKNINKHDIQLREHADRILTIEQGSFSAPPPVSNRKSISSELVKSSEFQNFVDRKTRNAGITVKSKSLLPDIQNNTIITTDATNPPQRIPGVVGGPVQRMWLRQFLPVMPATSASFVYTKENVFTNSAEAQATEGAEKAESGITFTEVTGSIATYAHWLKMSRQVMTDNLPMVDFTQRRLLSGLEQKIEDALIDGDGTSGKISGLLDTGNFTVFTPTISDTQVDSLRKAKLALEAADYQAGLVILNPTDTSAIELLKDVDGNYLVGKPIEGGLYSLWGVPVYSTTAITAGTFCILDNQQAVSLHLREDSLIELSDSDDDNFTKNLITVRAETRLGLAVHLPAGVISGLLKTA